MSAATRTEQRTLGGEFRVGRVLDRAISVYRQNFLVFSLVALAASTPALGTVVTGIDPSHPNSAAGAWGALALFAVSYLFFLLSQGILVFGAFQALRGRSVVMKDSIAVGLARLMQMIAISVIVGLIFIVVLAVALGLETAVIYAAILVTPGFAVLILIFMIFLTVWIVGMLASCLFVAIPVCIVERLGPWRSLRRSAALTKGSRWRLFGIILLLFLGITVLGQIIVIVAANLGGFLVGLAASIAWRTFWGAYFAILVVVTYYELRLSREGVDIDQIVSVFE